jgi:TonB family protein
MTSIKAEKTRQNMLRAICFSLAIHMAVGTVIAIGLSANLRFSSGSDNLNPLWVSLDAKSKGDGFTSGKRYPENKVHYAKEIIALTAQPERSKSSQKKALTSAIPDNSGYVRSAGYDAPGITAAGENAGIYTGTVAQEKQGVSFGAGTADPLYREKTPPVYPRIARIRGYEGAVLISTEILPDGNVGNLKIKKSSGYAILDQAAIEAVKNWKFEPAKKMGKPFATWRDHVIKFFLNDDNSQS